MDAGVISSLFDHPVSDGLLLLDQDGRCLQANPAATRRGLDRLVERHATSLSVLYQRLRDGERTVACELPDAARPLRGRLRAISLDGEVPVAYSLSIQLSEDVDDWLQAAESGGHALWAWDVRTDRFDGTGIWHQLIGRADGTSSSFEEMEQRVHPEDRTRMREAIGAYLTGQSPSYLCEYRCRQGDTWHWVRCSGRITARDVQQAPLRMTGSLTVIDDQKLLELRLREQRCLVEDTQRLAGMSSWSWDTAADRVQCAPELRALLGLDDALPVRAWLRRCHRHQFPLLRSLWRSLQDGPAAVDAELVITGVAGALHLQVWASPQGEASAVPVRVLAQVQNITRQRQADADARRGGELLRRVAELGRIGGCEIDAETRTLHWTGECAGLHGREGESMSLEALLGHYTTESCDSLQEAMHRVACGASAETIELCFYRPDGQQVWTQAVVDFQSELGARPRYLVLFRDISRERAASARIERLAHYDALTGLPNRTRLREDIEAALTCEPASYQALLLLDIASFGGINEAHGHAAGDVLLKSVAARLHMLLDGGDLFGRVGGDEFAVLLRQGERRHDTASIAQRIVDDLSLPLPFDATVLRFGINAGIAPIHKDVGFDELLRAAGVALQGARQGGRNRIELYSPDAWKRTRRRLDVEQALRGALEHEEFTLAYQPLIDITRRRVSGVEALLRWHPAGLGQCGPDEFISIAEASGDIAAIGDWVLREACRQASAWDALGIEFGRMSVNVSVVQLRDPLFADRVLAICAEVGLAAARLELEITESTLLRDSVEMRTCFDTLVAAGVALAIDDFGTGFSSLSYLSRFPISRLKIDRSFIAELSASQPAVEVTRAIIQLGKALRMQVLAEGVESTEDERTLLDYGCDEVQGFLYSRPLPPRDMARWLKAQPGLLAVRV